MFFWNSFACSKPSMYIWKFLVHVLLKPSLKNFEHKFTSVWNEYSCIAVWTFFEIALWDCKENWSFPILWPLLCLLCWYTECSTLIASSLRIWNSSARIPSPPLALFTVMLPTAAAAAAAKSLQLCPTLCDPIDGLLPVSSVPEILQARTLEWVAISFNAWKWKVKVKLLIRVQLLATHGL